MTQHMIWIQEYCTMHRIEPHFIEELEGHGLLSLAQIEGKKFIAEEDLPQVEHLTHLHYELDINLPGIEAIRHLLQRMNALQARVQELEQYQCWLQDYRAATDAEE